MTSTFGAPPATSRATVPWVYLSTVAFFLAGAAFYLYLARILPQDELGSIVVLLAIASIVSAAFRFGLGSGFQHFLSYHLGRGDTDTLRVLVRSALLAALVLSLAAALATVLLSEWLSIFFLHSTSYQPTVELLGAYTGLLTALTLLQSAMLGLQRFVSYSALSVLTYGLSYGVPIAFLTVWPDVRSAVLGWTLGAAIGVGLFLFVILRQLGPGALAAPATPAEAAPVRFRTVFFYSLPLFVSALVTTGAMYIDRLILASLTNLTNVGIYNYAILVGSGSLVIVAPFATILLPKLSELYGREDFPGIRRMVQTSITLIVLVYAPVAFGLASVGPFVLTILVGPSFLGASVPMEILLLLTAVSVPVTILTSLATGIRRPSVLVYAAGCAVAANAGLSFLLVPVIGMSGAAIGNSAMTWAALAVLLFALRDTRLVVLDLRSLSRVWGSSGLMFLCVAVPLTLLGYRTVLVPPFIGGGIVVLLLALRFSRAVPRDVGAYFVHLLPRRLAFLAPAIWWLAPAEPEPPSTGPRSVPLWGGGRPPEGGRAEPPGEPAAPAPPPASPPAPPPDVEPPPPLPGSTASSFSSHRVPSDPAAK